MKVTTGRIAQIVIISIAATLILVLAGGIWKGKSQRNQQNAPETTPADAAMKLTDMEFTEMEHGKRFWKLSASEARYFQDKQQTQLQQVHLTFYLDKTGEEIRVESTEGILHAGTKNIELLGGTRAELPREYIVTMGKALYDHQDRKVRSNEPVRISGPGIEVEGGHWEYSIPTHVAIIGGGVKASLVGAKLRLEK